MAGSDYADIRRLEENAMADGQITPEMRMLASQLFDAVARIVAGVQQPRKDATRAGVTRSQLAALRILAQRESCTMQELAASVGVTSPTMTSTVKLLVKKGYVDRRHGEQDWRTVRISISPSGREAQQHALDQRVLAFAEAVQSLSAEQRAMLMVSLPALRALADQVRSS
jgi:DNA-binding MarR family transcriptional regulator